MPSAPAISRAVIVSRVVASRFDKHTVYATFDRHKMGDFKPYVLASTDRFDPLSGNAVLNGIPVTLTPA